MAELKDDFRSKFSSAIRNGNAEIIRKLLTQAKSLKAKDELEIIYSAIRNESEMSREIINQFKSLKAKDALEMIEQAISSNNAFTHILYKGKSFPTIKSLAEALAIPPEILKQRMMKKWPQEKWADAVKQNNISYMGKEYKSYIELADKLKIPKATLYKRIRDQWPAERWGESTLKNNRENRIVERYQQGDNIKKLAISFGLKMKVIEDLLDRNGVLKPDDKKEANLKKQLNIRLDSNYQKKISDIRNYWNKKGVFQFAEKQLTDLNALNSEATLSKFILETALDNLYLELQNELSIDNNIEKICRLRLEDKNLNSLWKKVKLKHYDNGVFKNFVSNEIESYQNKIEQVGQKLIGLNSRKDNVEGNLILQEKLWKIAIKKSYLIPDKNDEETSKESEQIKLMELLKNKYPDI